MPPKKSKPKSTPVRRWTGATLTVDQAARHSAFWARIRDARDENLERLRAARAEEVRQRRNTAFSQLRSVARAAQRLEDGCPICFDSMTQDTVYVTPCAHVFHEECIAHSLLERSTCPVCREEIRDDALTNPRVAATIQRLIAARAELVRRRHSAAAIIQRRMRRRISSARAEEVRREAAYFDSVDPDWYNANVNP